MTGRAAPNLWTIPAGSPFVDALARELLRETGGQAEQLARYRILLPTRRACRALRDACLRLSDGRPVLLPRMQPLGDVDATELSLEMAAFGQAEDLFSLPPALTPLRRRLLLARTILDVKGFSRSPDQALALADALGDLMDQIHTEGLDLNRLDQLVPGEFAMHWQLTLDFLDLLKERWPLRLQEMGAVEASQRRRLLLEALSAHWRAHPPAEPIIAAGSTGSIPATADLLSVIAHLPQGRVVLPGLDLEMSEEAWSALTESHPQAGLKALLDRIGAVRSDVRLWPVPPHPDQQDRAIRTRLASETMRPAATAHEWTNLMLTWSTEDRAALSRSLKRLRLLTCDTTGQEALAVALLIREALETPGRTVAVVTPDRTLGRQITAACDRFGIAVNDSGGMPLAATPVGSWLRLVIRACMENLDPVALLSLIRHDFAAAGSDSWTFRMQVNDLERNGLRGMKPDPGMEGLRQKVPDDPVLNRIEPILSPLLDLGQGRHAFSLWLDTHLAVSESLASTDLMPGALRLWQGDDGETAAAFLAELRRHAQTLPDMSGDDYAATLDSLMAGISVRPTWGLHPRVFVLGQMESRLVQADLMILSGMNEGTWPQGASADPWMSRPMRQQFGLPAAEQATGLTAHDFVQGFCAGDVVLTRSRRVEGAPTLPSRWLQRLETVLRALGVTGVEMQGFDPVRLARDLDRADAYRPCERPAPTPPLHLRPRKLSATRFGKLLRDPYEVYAREILRLRSLDEIGEEADAADRGDAFHAALAKFVDETRDVWPPDPLSRLLEIGREVFEEKINVPHAWGLWWPRFQRMAAWFVDQERAWRRQGIPGIVEGKGTWTFTPATGGSFTIEARADRIDRMKAGGAAVIDYKSGTAPSTTAMINGLEPQLPLESLILRRGGFPGLDRLEAEIMAIWTISGASKPGDVKTIKGAKLQEALINAEDGVLRVVETFADEAMPYLSLPDPNIAPPEDYQDYRHLARVQEWQTGADGEGDE